MTEINKLISEIKELSKNKTWNFIKTSVSLSDFIFKMKELGLDKNLDSFAINNINKNIINKLILSLKEQLINGLSVYNQDPKTSELFPSVKEETNYHIIFFRQKEAISVSHNMKGPLDDDYTLYDDGTILHYYDRHCYRGGQNHKEILTIKDLSEKVKNRLLNDATEENRELVKKLLELK